MASAVTSLTNLTEILTGVEQKLEGAVTQLKSRLQEVAASERESIALVDEALSSKLKELTTRAHTEINCSIQDTHTALVKRLGEVTSHKRILGRAMLATPRPALIHATSALHKRINSLHLEVDLHQDWMRHPVDVYMNKMASSKRLQCLACVQTRQPTFHTNRGNNIVLLQNKTEAELVTMDKTLFSMGGMVVLSEAMAQNCLYQRLGDSTASLEEGNWRHFLEERDDFKGSYFKHFEDVHVFARGCLCNSTLHSMMAGVSSETHERECAVCTNDFTTPKILPCGHLLCRQCVISWLDSKSDAGCPLCRYPIAEKQNESDGNSADIADALPTEYVMEALVDTAHVLDKEHICCVCDDAKADFICMQCLDMMCSSCYKIHKKFSATRSHDVESVSTVTP
ncbi:hypothetical protein C0Q70_17573 [Pomacea canaliculata]|uniref:RING-type domain-containing protein n=1 Tax=Pomacea canaliculata TaxID=400727 RepID=A0A2T7NKT4_POMCA|nr:hypothetical protein C0Q70_17573 [Pomacea canaliculata]